MNIGNVSQDIQIVDTTTGKVIGTTQTTASMIIYEEVMEKPKLKERPLSDFLNSNKSKKTKPKKKRR